jgi:uncharacterized protein involved in exopolysaccharide biosynthesis
VNREANLSQALHLVNGDTVTNKIAQSRLIRDLLAEKKSAEEIIGELYVRALSRKPTEAEVKKLTEIVARETKDAERVKELAAVQARLDVAYGRLEERVAGLKADLKKLPKESKDSVTLGRQIDAAEKQLAAARLRHEANVPAMIYGDILWGLFNSTEFTFNH